MKQIDAMGFDVSRETQDRLRTYAALLLKWNRTINLISRSDEANIWERHIANSLALLPDLPPGFSHAIDLGSGGGLPGLVLAIATCRPFHLIESDQRKAAFLREAGRLTETDVTVHADRIENAIVAPALVITARAVAKLSLLLDWAARLLAPGGVCIFPKGRTAETEITEARSHWNMQVRQRISPTDAGGRILRISEISRVARAI